jgi:hypothetical protein
MVKLWFLKLLYPNKPAADVKPRVSYKIVVFVQYSINTLVFLKRMSVWMQQVFCVLEPWYDKTKNST